MTTTVSPKRAFVLEGKFQANSADELAATLIEFAGAIQRDELYAGHMLIGSEIYRYQTSEGVIRIAPIEEWQEARSYP